MKSFVIALAVIGVSASFCRAQIIYNGNFETGNLSGWTTFTTPNGTLGPSGLPAVTQFDVSGSGTPSDAAQFQVGEVTFDHTQQGGGIYQTFNVGAGQYVISADFAAYESNPLGNVEAGVETVSVDSVTVGTLDFGAIKVGQTERGVVDGTLNLGAGTHRITIEITRPWLNGEPPQLGATPYEYVDNVGVAAVPEPSIAALGMCGLALAFSRRIKRKEKRR